MTKRALIVASLIGLAAAIATVPLLPHAAASETLALIVLGLDIIAAGLAGRVVLGRVPVHRYFRLGVVVLSGLAAALVNSAGTNYLISIDVSFGRANYVPPLDILLPAIIGFVLYLLAATVYGFAAARQGVAVRSRIGLLLLLLLAVLPVLNVLGLLGITITAFLRGAPTRVLPAASA